LEELFDMEIDAKSKEIEEIKRKIEVCVLSKDIPGAVNEVVNYILNNHKIKTLRFDEKEEYWIFQGGIYLPEGKTYINEICNLLFGITHTKHKVNNVATIIASKTYIDSEDFFNKQNKYPFLIAVNNGILDLKTLELQHFNHDYYFFNKLSMDFNPNGDCPKIKEFINQITSREDDVKVIQELFGFCLVKEYFLEKSFMFYGANGRNGKSKLLNIIKNFIGDKNVSGLNLEDIEKDQFALSNLHNKMVNISGDISNAAIRNTGNFKSLTGRDFIEANRKFKKPISFISYAKMIFAANELPAINTLSDAFWLRWVVIEFPYQFLPQKEINSLPADKRDNVFLQDPDVVLGLMTDEEMEGLLLWAIDGLNRIIKNKDFSNKETARQTNISWLKRSNSVAAFILDEVIEDYDSHIIKGDFKRRYLSYCRSNKIKSLNDRVINATLGSETGAVSGRKTVFVEGIGNEQSHVWEGIKFKTQVISIPVPDGIQKDLVSSEEFVVNSLKTSFDSLVKDGQDVLRVDYFLDKGFVDNEVQSFFDVLKVEGKVFESSPGVWRLIN